MDNNTVPPQGDQNALLTELQYLRGEVQTLRAALKKKGSANGWTWLWAILAILFMLGNCAPRNPVGYKSAVPQGSTIGGSYSAPAKPAEPTVALQAPKEFKGRGDFASEPFLLDSGLLTVAYSHDGSANFAAWLLDGQGNNVELIWNEIGSVSGSRAFRIPADGYYVISLQADGNWSVGLK